MPLIFFISKISKVLSPIRLFNAVTLSLLDHNYTTYLFKLCLIDYEEERLAVCQMRAAINFHVYKSR